MVVKYNFATESMNQKKIIASVLSLTLTLGSFGLPIAESGIIVNQISASAEETTTIETNASTSEALNTAINQAENNSTLKLTSDVTVSNTAVTIPNGKNITLDLNGHSITNANVQKSGICALRNEGTLTIIDSVENSTGAIFNTNTDNSDSYYTVINSGTMTIESGTIKGSSPKSSVIINSYYMSQSKNTVATLKITGGLIESTGGSIAIKNDEGEYENQSHSKLVITGGTIKNDFAKKEVNGETEYHNVLINFGIADISGGEFIGSIWTITQKGLELGNHGGITNISGGTFNYRIAAMSYDPETKYTTVVSGQTDAQTENYKNASCALNITGGNFSNVENMIFQTDRVSVNIKGGTFGNDTEFYFNLKDAKYSSETNPMNVSISEDVYNKISSDKIYTSENKIFRNENGTYNLVTPNKSSLTVPEGVTVTDSDGKEITNNTEVVEGSVINVAVSDTDKYCYVTANGEKVEDGKLTIGKDGVTLKAVEHNIVTDEAVPATCLKDGKTAGSHCETCDSKTVAQEVVKATGHNYETDSIIKKPTCISEGELLEKCKNCGETKIVAIAKSTTHNEVVDKAVPATCTTEGKTEGSHCADCGKVIKAQEVVPATGHKFGEFEVTKKATCTTDGEQVKKCTECGETITEVIKATGHKFGEVEVTKKATCTTDGEQVKKCTECGETITEVIKATGHKESAWIIDKQPTKTSEGSKHTECTVCGQVIKTEKIDKIKDTVNPTPVVKTSIKNAKVTLSKTVVDYNGKEIKPSVTVKLGKTKLVKGKDYTVSFTNNKAVGKATVTITGNGKYKDTVKSSFIIIPAQQKITKLNAKTNGFGVAFKADKSAENVKYVVEYCSYKNFKGRGRAVVNTNTYSNINLKKNHKYYVRVRTVIYTKGVSYYGDWSAVKAIRTK